METQIFYWNGVVIWWAFCICGGCMLVAALVLAPLASYKAVKKQLWQWKYAAILAQTGFTQDDVIFAAAYARRPKGADTEELMAWVRDIKERGDSIKARKAI